MPDWMKYNHVKKSAIVAPRPIDRLEDNPSYQGPECLTCDRWTGDLCLDESHLHAHCPILGVRFRYIDARDLKRSPRSKEST